MTGRTYTDGEFEAAATRHHTHELEAEKVRIIAGVA